MKVVPLKNFNSQNILIVSVMLMIAPHLAFAGDQNDGESSHKSWFVEGRYQKSLSEADGFNDTTSDNTRVVSGTGESWSNLGSTGVAIGRYFNDGKASLSLGYDRYGTVNKSFATATEVSGRIINNIVLPMDVSNIMFELGYNVPITADMFAIGLIGLGQSTINSKGFSVGGTTIQTFEKEVTNTSSRFGLGLGYNVSEKVQIIALAQSSKYGDAETNVNTVANPVAFTTKLGAVEASIRIRVAF
ncbi:porin family protein [Alphaproteobacteria bacterium]|nr:porin family protein [Alphaproteobacteria bacterium]